MKLVSRLSLVGLGVAAVAVLALSQGCSSTETPAAAGGGVGAPPAKPSAGATTSKTEHNYALQQLFMGDVDRNLAKSTTAWKKFGYNIDGKVSTKDSTDVCTPFEGAGKDAQVDGENGIDNTFGSRIIPIIQTFSAEVSKSITEQLKQGNFTVMIDTVGLTDDPKQTNTALSGQLFAGGKLANPTFTVADKWPVSPDLLVGGTLAGGSKVKFSDAYIVGGQWVNGTPSDVSIALIFGGVSLEIKVRRGTIVFEHAGNQAANGTISGVLDTEELITGLQKVAGRISTSLCSGSAFDSIAKQIRQASDIMADGTNAAGTKCNAISIGIGFTAAEIAPPSVVAMPAAPGVDMCMGGGADAGTRATDAGTGATDAAAE